MRRRTTFAPCVFADLELIVELDTALRERIEYDFRGHQTCETSRSDHLIGVLFDQYVIGPRIDQNDMRGVDLDWLVLLAVRRLGCCLC